MKKKKFDLKVDHSSKKIIIGKAFSQRQSDVESDEYKKLCEVVQTFPEYDVEVKQIKKNPHKESYRGLNYEYMEMYISVKGTSFDRQEYDDMRLLAKCHSKRFPVIKKWFLNKYQEVAKYGAKQEFLTNHENAA